MKLILVWLFSFGALITFNLQAQVLEPGLWKIKTNFKLNGIAIPKSDEEECVTAAEAKDAKKTVTNDLKRNDCELKNWKVYGKNIEASISCATSAYEAEGTLKGTFTKKSYELIGDAKGTVEGIIPTVASIKLNGAWLKACAE